jgi:hypothetical protein
LFTGIASACQKYVLTFNRLMAKFQAMIVPGKGSRILEGPMKHHLNLNFPLLAA